MEYSQEFFKLIEEPYGKSLPESELPEKVKDSEEADLLANAGKTHYEVLHSHRGASPAELKACYKRMALLLHPDKNPAESAAAGFKKVSDAFTVLSDAYERGEYDATLDGGLGLADPDAAEEGANLPPTPANTVEGPPGLKKRRTRPTAARGGRR